MANIIFFEKTGCINNTKQKKILELAGHNVEAINLLHHPWTKDELLSFFEGTEVKTWFNHNAPSVTAGDVKPEEFTKESALEALVTDRILIKRPLLIIGDEKVVGFDKEKLQEMIGLEDKTVPQLNDLLSQNLTDCPQKSKGISSCD